MPGQIKVATCQFAVSGNIKRNANTIRSYMQKARNKGAELVHFPECALSGYASVDFENFADFYWDKLKEETLGIMEFAGELNVWVVLGSVHRLTEPNKPYNCLYLINPEGELEGRYDKIFCMEKELEFYTPGERVFIFELNGIKCALLICFEVRFAEIYRELKKEGVEAIFQSFYNARQKGPSVHTHIMRQSMQCRAGNNHFWVSMTNSSGYYSPYPSCFITPDGKIEKQLKFNKAGFMVNTIDMGRDFYDPAAGFREFAMGGKLNNCEISIDDPRAKNLKTI